MKKQYTRKQITEAIAYWEKQLRAVNEEGPAAGNDATEDGAAAYMERLRRDCMNSSFPDAVEFIDQLANDAEHDSQRPIPESEFRELYKDDKYMQSNSAKFEDGVNYYDSAMHLFRRGCKYVGFMDGVGGDLYDYLTSDECPEYVTFSVVRGSRDYLNEQLQIGFGEHILPDDEVPMLHRYKVVSLWYKPVYKTDVVEAEDEDDAEYRVEEMHARSTKSRADSDEVFDSVESVKPL